MRCEYDSDEVLAVARKTKTGYEVIIANTSVETQEIDVNLEGQRKHLVLDDFETKKVKFAI